jgi:hypothetical protein
MLANRRMELLRHIALSGKSAVEPDRCAEQMMDHIGVGQDVQFRTIPEERREEGLLDLGLELTTRSGVEKVDLETVTSIPDEGFHHLGELRQRLESGGDFRVWKLHPFQIFAVGMAKFRTQSGSNHILQADPDHPKVNGFTSMGPIALIGEKHNRTCLPLMSFSKDP